MKTSMKDQPEKKLYLVCNAHLDPVWLWHWEEGLAEALSTFRVAARFCSEFDGFVFCHNEALLYQWVEEHDPGLFEQIRILVAAGRWHVMGGWYLQPDCNLLSGESFVRQILTGKRYFREKFGVEPTVAVNLDPFGHTRGLVQILAKSGYRGYLFCRPDEGRFPLPSSDFVWVGYDGSEILCHRPPDHYNSQAGKAAVRIRKWLADNSERPTGMLLWGIGDHGGGPSHEDLIQIADLMSHETGRRIEHAAPELYFDWLDAHRASLPRVSRALNPWGVGCYTSMARVKRRHRMLENQLYLTERMATNALIHSGAAYPRSQLSAALEDLLFCQFHDALPGSSVVEVEEAVIQKLDHGLEILARTRAGLFLKCLSGQPEASPGEFPIFVYNSHPHELEEIVVCEFQPQEPNFDPSIFWQPELFDEVGKPVPVQLEKESCNIATDQRKRIVFPAQLRASSLHRFSCFLRSVPSAPRTIEPPASVLSCLTVQNSDCSVSINRETGLMDSYQVHGVEVLGRGAFSPLVMKDSADPWGMKVDSFRNLEGSFRLMPADRAAQFAGIDSPSLLPVRVIEQGPVRTVIESLLEYGHSRMVLRYRVPARGSEIEIEVRVFWEEKDRMLKLAVPSCFPQGKCSGQVAFGIEEFASDEKEHVAQKWLAVQSDDGNLALTIINDRIYGFDFCAGELRLSLLRSPAYAGHPVDDVTPIVRQDRFEIRMDQGEHRFVFWMNCSPARSRLDAVTMEAAAKNEAYLALCAFPSGTGERAAQGIVLSNPAIQLAAWKLSEDGDRIILRLHESTGRAQTVTVTIPGSAVKHTVNLRAFEIKTIALDRGFAALHEVDLLERAAAGSRTAS